MRREDIPNLISILRIFLSIPVIWMLLEQQFTIALVLFAVAGISDGLDGYLAKHYGWESRLGGLLIRWRIRCCWSPATFRLLLSVQSPCVGAAGNFA